MNIPFSPPDITQDEIDEVMDTLKSGWITTGPKTKKFESNITEYCNSNKTVCLSSATASLEMTLRVLGIGEGDEVILPAYTYTATCSAVCHVGATPILIDSQKNCEEMDYELVAEAINEKTKVIIPVDIAGILCDYDTIFEIVESKKDLFTPNSELQEIFNRIIVVSDCAHGFGAIKNNKKAGTFADFTCFSFHAVKNLTTAEGGAVTWKNHPGLDNEDLYKEYQIYSLHGQTKDAFHNAFKDYPILLQKHITENSKSSGHLYLIRINDIGPEERNEIILKMGERGVSTNVHYKPLPLLTAYKNLGFDISDYPNAYNLFKNEISLPLYSTLTDEEVDYIIENLLEVLKEY